MADYPLPPKPDGRPNASFGGYTEAPLTEAEIEELKNRDTREPEEIATDEERLRCLKIVDRYRQMVTNAGYKITPAMAETMFVECFKEIDNGAKTPAPSSD